MWRQNGYENKMGWILVILVMLVLALTALWLYQSNVVTFGLKHLDANDCPSGNTAASCVGANPDN